MSAPHPGYWRRVKAITVALLVVWFIVSFVLTYFARDLEFRFFGWPFSYWMAAQGALVVYALIIATYAWVVNRLDRDYGVEDPPSSDDTHEP